MAGLRVGQAFGGTLATWVGGQQLQPPGSWAPKLHMQYCVVLNIRAYSPDN